MHIQASKPTGTGPAHFQARSMLLGPMPWSGHYISPFMNKTIRIQASQAPGLDLAISKQKYVKKAMQIYAFKSTSPGSTHFLSHSITNQYRSKPRNPLALDLLISNRKSMNKRTQIEANSFTILTLISRHHSNSYFLKHILTFNFLHNSNILFSHTGF